MTSRHTYNRTRHQSEIDYPNIVWWRFAIVVLLLSFIGIWFVYYSKPSPTLIQEIIFFALLVMILFETFQAGWYKNSQQRRAHALRISPERAEQMRSLVLDVGGFLLFFIGFFSILAALFFARDALPLVFAGFITLVFGLIIIFRK